MSETELPRGLRWRLRRGMKELDLVLTRWAEACYANAPDSERAAFDALLACEDPDIWSWLMGYREPPEGATRDLVEQLRRYL